MPNSILHFTYQRGSLSKSPGLHELRDSDAFAEIHAALHGLGYRFGALLINNRVSPEDDVLPAWDSSDIVVVTTRPPLDDEAELERRYIERTGSALENEVLRHCRPCFKTCKRMVVQLSREAAAHLGRYADRGRIKFRLHNVGNRTDPARAVYHQYRDPYARARQTTDTTMTRTAAFLLVRRLEPNGPLLLVAFGMDGIMTLTWCHLLRTRFAHLLAAPRFVMAEITLQPIPKQATSLAFAADWRVELLLDVSPDLLEAPPPFYEPP